MTSVFDGMAGAMATTFGAPVLWLADGEGDGEVVQAMLRTAPIEVAGADGHPVLIMAPTLQVPKNILPLIKRGDHVSAVSDPDAVYIVINKLPNGSPASDAMLICELERRLDC